MPATFLGKWRIYVPPDRERLVKSNSEGYAAYWPSPGDWWLGDYVGCVCGTSTGPTADLARPARRRTSPSFCAQMGNSVFS